MQIRLKELRLKNFKAVKEAVYCFYDRTKIVGANGTGKSTIYDAFCWLLFGKDSSGRADFEIKRKEKGEVIHNLEYSVTGVFEMDGKEIAFRRTLVEKWVKTRGTAEKAFQGNNTEYFINEVPVKQKEYDEKLKELFRLDIFPMISDPSYFAAKMNWKDRREVLFTLLEGEISDRDIFLLNGELKPLEAELGEKTIDELQKALLFQKKGYVKEREEIPIRIDTLAGELSESDPADLAFRINFIRGGLRKVEEVLQSGRAEEEKKLSLRKQMYYFKAELARIEAAEKGKIAAAAAGEETKGKRALLQGKIRLAKLEIDEMEKKISSTEKRLSECEQEIINLRKEYLEEAEKEFFLEESQRICPTCGREFDNLEQVHEELLANFNEEKARKLKKIQEKGKAEKEEKETIQKKLLNMEEEKGARRNRLAELEKECEELPEVEVIDEEKALAEALRKNEEYQQIGENIAKMEAELEEATESAAVAEARAKKAEIEKELEEVLKEKARAEKSEEIREKIRQLEEEERKLSQEILRIEKLQYLAEQYIRTKSELIEKKINHQFKNVEFKLFEEQVNGGIAECCIVMVGGVEYNSANTAGRLNAGLDIINILAEHYDCFVPVWVDNRESVTEVIPTVGQRISLVVDKNSKKLEMMEEEHGK